MNRREAKREACFRAAVIIQQALASETNGGFTEPDEAKMTAAFNELPAELVRRGGEQ